MDSDRYISQIIVIFLFMMVMSIIQYASRSVKKDTYKRLANNGEFSGFLNLIKIYLNNQDYDEAIRTINEWLANNPFHVKGLSTKAFIHIFSNQIDMAHKTIDRALKIDPEYPELLFLS